MSDIVVAEKPVERTVLAYDTLTAQFHFNPGNERAMTSQRYLTHQVRLVGRAEHEAMRLLLPGLEIERDEAENIRQIRLTIPAASAKDAAAAREALAPDPEAEAKRYPNSYHLVEVIKRPNELPLLRFVLLERVKQIATKGRKAGEEIKRAVKLPVLYLQMIITRWLRPPSFERLPSVLKQGTAQEVVQALASHCGLQEKASQTAVGLPSFERADAKFWREKGQLAHQCVAERLEPLSTRPAREILRGRFKPDDLRGDELWCVDPDWQALIETNRPIKHQPLRFASSQATPVFLRLWHEHGRRRVGLYVRLPLDDGQKPWWLSRCDEFKALPAWGDRPLPKRGMLVPLSFEGGRRRLKRHATALESPEHGRFVRALNGRDWQVCWSLVVEREGAFFLQIVTKRQVAPLARPNLLGVHFAQPEND
ncbi:MAG: hypothetical protein HYT48_02295 [Candidatus Vogelbacteria bacterium]|nr:hypothetical protein [Candidatus Vogelbacteria bacterium]